MSWRRFNGSNKCASWIEIIEMKWNYVVCIEMQYLDVHFHHAIPKQLAVGLNIELALHLRICPWTKNYFGSQCKKNNALVMPVSPDKAKWNRWSQSTCLSCIVSGNHAWLNIILLLNWSEISQQSGKQKINFKSNQSTSACCLWQCTLVNMQKMH